MLCVKVNSTKAWLGIIAHFLTLVPAARTNAAKDSTMATSTVGLVNNWLPPSRENYDLILSLWKWFPVVRVYPSPPFYSHLH